MAMAEARVRGLCVTACAVWFCDVGDDGAAGAWLRQPTTAKTAATKVRRYVNNGLADKIGNRRGQFKWFSDAELERRPQTHCPIGVLADAVDRLGVIEAQNQPAEQVGADRSTVALERRPYEGFVRAGRAGPLEGVPGLPRDPGVVEQRALNRREADRQETKREVAHQREAPHDVPDPDARADQLVQGTAARGAPPHH